MLSPSLPVRYSELPLSVGRVIQSAKTHFLHLYEEDLDLETIPFYENACFALALFRQKTMEGVNEGKKLFEKLFLFQIPEGLTGAGNFPVYLHQYPLCHDSLHALKIATLLNVLQREFTSVIGSDFREKLLDVQFRLLQAIKQRRVGAPFPPLWEHRFQALIGKSEPFDVAEMIVSSKEATEWLLTSQLLEISSSWVRQVFHPQLQVYVGPCGFEEQEGSHPRPNVLEWMGAGSSLSQRLREGHPLQLSLAVFAYESWNRDLPLWSGFFGKWKIYQEDGVALTYLPHVSSSQMALRFLWQGVDNLHSLVIPSQSSQVSISDELPSVFHVEVLFELPLLKEGVSHELEEVVIFCNLSSETQIYIDGKKGSAFESGQRVEIRTPTRNIELSLVLVEGEGRFFGGISQGNRPLQRLNKKGDFKAYDWKIGWRTLERSPKCKVRLCLNSEDLQEN